MSPWSQPSPPDARTAATPKACPLPKWTRRLGAAGILFFLIKGLLWILIPALAARGLWSAF
jgi:uncharacterized membrane protein